MEPVITFIALFAAVFGIMYVFLTTRNKERMALIEKGADASLFYSKEGSRLSFSWSKFTLKTGMLAIGIAAGMLVGALLAKGSILDEDTSYVSMIFLFGGISLVIFYVIDRKIRL